LRAKKFTEAAETFRQLSALKPGDANAPNNLGEAYLGTGRYNEAIDSFKQAIRLNPALGRAYFNLGKAYLALGNREGAMEQYSLLQSLDANWAEKLYDLINP
jgi:tetratricopeptide (TPR) repeat protein